MAGVIRAASYLANFTSPPFQIISSSGQVAIEQRSCSARFCRMRASIVMTIAPTFSGEAVREPFRAWYAEHDSLDTELNESLVALEAYQLHLDVWQQQLARERDELRTAREQFDRDRAASDKNHAESSAASVTELNAAREKITALTTL